jgi:hypothetical protein
MDAPTRVDFYFDPVSPFPGLDVVVDRAHHLHRSVRSASPRCGAGGVEAVEGGLSDARRAAGLSS